MSKSVQRQNCLVVTALHLAHMKKQTPDFFVHVNDCAATGHSKIVDRTGDNDVIVIAVANFHLYPAQTKLFEKFGNIDTCRSVST